MITLKHGATVVSQSIEGKVGKLTCLFPLEALPNLVLWGVPARKLDAAAYHIHRTGKPITVVRSVRFYGRQHQDVGFVTFPELVAIEKVMKEKNLSWSAYYDQLSPVTAPTMAEATADVVARDETAPTAEAPNPFMVAVELALKAGRPVERTALAYWVYAQSGDKELHEALKAAKFWFSGKRQGWYFSAPAADVKRHTVKSLQDVQA